MASTSASGRRAAEATAAAEARASSAAGSRHVFLVRSLLTLATLVAVLTVITTWVNRQVLDNKSWQNTSAKVIQDPEVRNALSVYLVNQLYDNVNVAAQLRQRLPPNIKPLAAPVAGALREPSTNAVALLLGRPRTQQLWINANTVAHQKLVNVLENKTGNGISTGNGAVTVDLGTLVTQLGTQLGLPAAALDRLPADAGVITVMRSDQLSAAQTGVQLVRALSTWLLVLALALYAVAVYLARGRRREVLRTVGWCFVGLGLILLLVRRAAGNYTVDQLVLPANRVPAHHIWLIATSELGDIGYALILYGAVAVLGAMLAGPSRIATTVRRWIAPVLNRRPAMAWSAVAFVYLLVLLWGGTHALRTWWGILLFGGLLAAGVVALRKETLSEFPTPAPTRTPTPASG
jgi:hypothetical protein